MNNQLKKDSMIYPPINDLVEKVGNMIGDGNEGNRYSLVMTAAKRAREISKAEKINEKDKQIQSSDLRVSQRSERSRKYQNEVKKPIAAALDEIYNDEVYVTKGEEGYKTSNYDVDAENILDINYASDEEDIAALIGEAPSGVIVENDVPNAVDIEDVLASEN